MFGIFPQTSKNTQDTLPPVNSSSVLKILSNCSTRTIRENLNQRQNHSRGDKTSTPNRSQTNGVAEAAVGCAIEGTARNLYQSGLAHAFWPDAAKHYASARCFFDIVKDDKTPYELKLGEPSTAQLIPFGSLVEYKPSAKRE